MHFKRGYEKLPKLKYKVIKKKKKCGEDTNRASKNCRTLSKTPSYATEVSQEERVSGAEELSRRENLEKFPNMI